VTPQALRIDKAPIIESRSRYPSHRTGSAVPLALAVLAVACTPPLKAEPHYVLGPPYQAGAIWYYPRDSFDVNETGIAAIITDDTARLTTDGEVFDQTALAGGHPTLPLPAIARLTNLENGRVVVIRLNDRGSGDPHRLVDVTRRTASLLGFAPDGVARVRLTILANDSHAAEEALPGAPSLAIKTAPLGLVAVADLPFVAGVRQANGRALPIGPIMAPGMTVEPAPRPVPPLRLPETVTQTEPTLGHLIVRLDMFDDYQYAAVQCAKMGWPSQHIVPVVEGRARRFRVDSFPLRDVAQADMVLNQALAAGIPDARIVVD
jgi:rare lipoprotein A